MRRIIAAAGALALLAALLPGVAAADVSSNQLQVLSARNASTQFSRVDGCYEMAVLVSSSDAVYGGRPGPVNKQGLTSLAITVYDTCQPLEGKHYPAVFDGMAQDFTSLESTVKLDAAWVDQTFDFYDEVSGETLSARIQVTWQLVGEMVRDTSHTHVRVAGDGIVNGHDNDLMGDAVASAVLTLNGSAMDLGSTSDAHLELIKAHCQTIVWPHAEWSDLACY